MQTSSETPPESYPNKWETDTVLSDGGTVAIRPIKPTDAPRIEALHSRLSPESIYFRFFTPLPRLTDTMLSRFVNVDYVDRMAMIALLGDQIIAVARYDRLPGQGIAEVAFLVDDAHQGRGLATIMLEYLVEAAKEAGIHRFIADTLPDNSRMLRIFRDAGFSDTREFQDGVIRVAFDIAPTTESVKRMQTREQKAVARSVSRIIAPKSIAVIGASRDPNSVGNVVFRNILESNFQGPVYPVNPASPFIASVKAYGSIAEIPGPIDLAVVIIPADGLEQFIDEAAEKQVGGLVIISSGFSDTDDEGTRVERELVRRARRNGMRVVGPASMGVANTDPRISLNATLAPYSMMPGRASLIAHSGALGLAIVEEARRRGIGIASFVSAGNRADISGNDMLHYWEQDPNTEIILLYLESFGNPRTFARVARRVARAKPIVAVKARRYASTPPSTGELANRSSFIISPSGRTISSISSDIAVDALMKYTGVLRVDSLEQLFELGHGLVTQPLPRGRRVAILSNRGGPAPLAQDACEALGLVMAAFGPETTDALRRLVPSAKLTNPVELPSDTTPKVYGSALELLLSDSNVDAVIVLYIPTVVRRNYPIIFESHNSQPIGDVVADLAPAISSAQAVAESIAAAAQQVGSPSPKTVLTNFLTLPGVSVQLRRFNRELPNFDFPEMAATVLARMADYYAWRSHEEGELADLVNIDSVGAARLIQRALEQAREQSSANGESGPISTWIVGRSATELLNLYLVPQKEHVEVIGYLSFEVSLQLELTVTHDRHFGPIMSMGIAGDIAAHLNAKTYATLPLFALDIPKFIDAMPAIGLLKAPFGQEPHNLASLADVIARIVKLMEDNFAVTEVLLDLVSTPGGAYISAAEVQLRDRLPLPPAITRSLT